MRDRRAVRLSHGPGAPTGRESDADGVSEGDQTGAPLGSQEVPEVLGRRFCRPPGEGVWTASGVLKMRGAAVLVAKTFPAGPDAVAVSGARP